MKKILLTLAALSMGLAPVLADDLSVGYCDGGIVENSISATAVAIKLPADEFPMYRGTAISGVRIGLSANAQKGVRVFLRTSIDGPDILSFKTGALYAGWNDIYFDSPVDYPDGDLYIGYELTSGDAGTSHIEGLTAQNACFTYNGSSWADKSSSSQPLCIQALLSGYEHTDLAVLAADPLLVQVNQPFEFSGLVRNNTPQVLTGARMSYDTGDGSVEADAVMEEILPGEIGRFRIACDGISTTGDKSARLGVVSVDGVSDEYSFNDNINVPVQVALALRNVLIEEFTGQGCGNCPSGKRRIQEGTRGMDNVILVCHHIGFGVDQMTADGSSDLLFFYNSPGSSYAPAVMFDRTATSGGDAPVTTVGDAAVITDRVNGCAQKAAQAVLNVTSGWDPITGYLNVDVSVLKVAGTQTGSNPVVTVMLIEDGIVAYQNPEGDNYVHDEVVRKFLSDPLGKSVALDEETENTYRFSGDVPEKWNRDKMRIVTLVSNYNENDPLDCNVYNAVQTAMPDYSGVNEVGDSRANEIKEIYSVTGLRLDRLQKGINIVRRADGSVSKIMR